MSFGISGKPTTNYILAYNNFSLTRKGSKDKAKETTEHCRFASTSLVLTFDAPLQRTPRIITKSLYWQTLGFLGCIFAVDRSL